MALTLTVSLKPLIVAMDRHTAAVQAQTSTLEAIARAIANLSDPPPGRFIISVQEQ